MLSVLLSFLLLSPTAHAFTDVPDHHPYHEAVSSLQKQRIVRGMDGRNFWPDQRITRVEFITLLMRMHYTDETMEQCVGLLDRVPDIRFTDIDYSAWYGPAICSAAVDRVTTGFLDGSFQPLLPITIVEAAKMLSVAFNLTETALPDTLAPDPFWYRPYLKTLSQIRVIPPSVMALDHRVTRGEAAEMIHRLQEYDLTGRIPGGLHRTYDEVAQSIQWETYDGGSARFSLRYPAGWPAPEDFSRGALSPGSTLARRSDRRVYIGPRLPCPGYGSCAERRYFVDVYHSTKFDDALEIVTAGERTRILNRKQINGAYALLYDEVGICTSRRALIQGHGFYYILTAFCLEQVKDGVAERSFELLLEEFETR